jgi:hypothetical protein
MQKSDYFFGGGRNGFSAQVFFASGFEKFAGVRIKGFPHTEVDENTISDGLFKDQPCHSADIADLIYNDRIQRAPGSSRDT